MCSILDQNAHLMCAVAYCSANTSQQSLIANSTIFCRLTMDGEYNLDEEAEIERLLHRLHNR